MIKLVVSDVDGTLVPEGTAEIQPEVYEVIRKLKQKGITFAAASGRQQESVKSVFEPVEQEIYFISNNGGYVTYRDQVLACRVLKPDWVQEITEYLRAQEDTFYLLTTLNGDITDCRDPEMMEWLREGYKINIHRVEDVLDHPGDVVKISGYFKKIDAMKIAVPAEERFGSRLKVTAAGAHWVDFTAPEAEKGIALTELQKKLHIRPEETMAFGDNNNDISMLRCAKESYAVAGAREEVKAICRHVLPEGRDSVLNEIKKLL